MLKYKEMIQSSNGDEEKMWESVERIDGLLDVLKETNPELYRKFMEEQYINLNGHHINERLAKKMVSEMHHTDANGKVVKGEAVTLDEAKTLIADKTAEKQEKCKWDAYVAANAFAHDLAAANLNKSDILKAAKAFWFNDEDMSEKHKVFWYFKDWIFG